MLSRFTRNIKLPEWIRENKKLMNIARLCLGLLFVDLLLYSLLVAPSVARLQNREAQYSELRKKRTEAIMFEKQKKALAGIKAGIPAQKDMPLLIKELVQSARRLNLSVSSVKYDIPKRSGEELAMLSFSFPVEGRYADIKRFIYEIETSDRPIGIQDMKLESEKGLVKTDMKLFTYVKGQ